MNNISVKIDVGEYEVISSGSVITFENKDVTFYVDNLTIILKFIYDETVKGMSLNATVTSDKVLEFRFFNIDNAVNAGVQKPLNVGNVNGHQLFIEFAVTNIGDKGYKLISFTWLIKK